MTDLRTSSRRPSPAGATLKARTELVGRLGEDLEALRTATVLDSPSLDATMRAARRHTEAQDAGSVFGAWLRARPAISMAFSAFAIAIALLMVPITYQRTTGYDVVLTLGGSGVDPSRIKDVAESFRRTIGGRGVSVDAVQDDNGTTFMVRSNGRGDVRAAARAFAAQLNGLGYSAEIATSPIEERVSTNVYAFAYERVIEISTDGKTSAELENEIRSRLAATGLAARVSVRDRADGARREIQVNAEQDDGGAVRTGVPELVLTRDGQPLSGGFGVNVMMEKDASGASKMVVRVSDGERRIDAVIPNVESMSDAAIAAAIEAELARAGLDARVTVHGKDVEVEKR